MIKLILTAILAYLGYSLFLRYNSQNKKNQSSDKNSPQNKYSKMKIRDAEFKDIDEKE